MSEAPSDRTATEPSDRRPAPPTVREILGGTAGDLKAAGIESPVLEAERLLCHVLGVDRARLTLGAREPFPVNRGRELADAVHRRIRGEPLQHIEGEAAFRELLLLADRRSLVPRPETEQLVDLVLDWARRRRTGRGITVVSGARPRDRSRRPPIGEALDIGTGSGAIALALATEGIASSVLAIDRSAEALEQAADNAARIGTGDSVRFALVDEDMWKTVGPARFDLIVSNPPYIPDADIDALSAEVRAHDPRIALAGGPDGLDVVRDIVRGASEHLLPGGALCLELGVGQPAAVARMLGGGPWTSVTVHPDLARRDRFILGVR